VRLQRRHCLALAAAALAGPSLAAAPKPVAKFAQVFGTRIRYHEVGKPRPGRPTLVLQHGLGGTGMGDWGRVAPLLAQTHHVITVDQLGFGESGKPYVTYSIQLWVDVLGELLRGLKLSDFALAGESLGGWIAAQYTLQALRGQAASPGFVLPRPSRLILCNAAGLRQPGAEADDQRQRVPPSPTLAFQKAQMAKIFRAESYTGDEGVRGSMGFMLGNPGSYAVRSFAGNPGTVHETVDEQLAGITIPTLVVWGEHDGLIPLAAGRRYAEGIPGAQLVVIPGVGHVTMIEAPEAFMAAVRPFLLP
jgi:pimeloyl-ACP methyl ester carboxylesterase